jgi:ABC-type enterochelin transport system ATPase subunit
MEESYPEQMKSGVITFQSLNIEEGETEALAKKLGVSGQTLLIVKGDKKTDLTNDAFMYARTKPDKLKEKVKNAIDQD